MLGLSRSNWSRAEGVGQTRIGLLVLAAFIAALHGCDSTPTATDPHTPSVTGTVIYQEQITLPSNAVWSSAAANIELQDVSLQDVPATTISTLIIDDPVEVPFPFEIKYDRTIIDPTHTYAVNVRIRVNGELWFINTKAYYVITRGNPDHVDVVVEWVGN